MCAGPWDVGEKGMTCVLFWSFLLGKSDTGSVSGSSRNVKSSGKQTT